tara:strand:+ start:116 stop:301 length:186 start_codon:yes stop_codon:yes gene_type:complete
MKSKGLGDTIEKITKVTGIKAVADAVSKVTKKPCGCQQRKEALNNKFPYPSSLLSQRNKNK